MLEARLVVFGRAGARGVEVLDALLRDPVFEVVVPTAEKADLAFDAFRRFGKGTGHPARLNFGDLFPYALARARDLPLLSKGDDLRLTDVAAA